MTLEMLRAFFGWCAVFNVGVLVLWFLILLVAGAHIYRMQGKMLGLEPMEVRVLHYRTFAYYKVGTMLFNLAPYLALRILV